jgi:hypothetical protein
VTDLSERVADLAKHKLNLAVAKLRDEHFYASLPLCIIDAVFSIGVKYEGTKRTVVRWARSQNPQWALDRRLSGEEHGVSDFIRTLETMTADELANGPFGNRQRTSSRSGILKTDAIRQFAIALQQVGIERFDDIKDANKLTSAESLVTKIAGQRSGISFDYFVLLAGNELVKADRMICRFVADAAQVDTVSPGVAKEAVIGAAKLLKVDFPHLDTRLLDSEIWSYESQKAANRKKRRKPTLPAEAPEKAEGRR